MWLSIKPNSDNALALAWLNVIINERLYDYDFVNDWTLGFEDLAERVQVYTPDWAAEKTGVRQKRLQKLPGYMQCQNRPVLWGVATDQLGKGALQGHKLGWPYGPSVAT